LNIDFICTDPTHPVNEVLEDLLHRNDGGHVLKLVRSKTELSGGDLLFLVSCHELIDGDIRSQYRTTFVLHASDLPVGRGWSPHIWTVVNGVNKIIVSLLEAEDKIDSGDIWAQHRISLQGHELYDEINAAVFQAEIELIEHVLNHYTEIEKRPQDDRSATYYPRRTPEDSRIDPDKSIVEQFDLLRVADAERYPAFFDFRGHRYLLKIYKEP
jgi:methionyl-tRNA formyltransferase